MIPRKYHKRYKSISRYNNVWNNTSNVWKRIDNRIELQVDIHILCAIHYPIVINQVDESFLPDLYPTD